MSQMPYGQQQFQQPAPRQFFPALNGAVPVTGGRQVLVWLLDGVIFGLPVAILSFLCFLPMLFTIFSNIDKHAGSANVRHENWSDAELSAFFTSLLVGLLLNGILMLAYYGVYWYLIAVKGRTPGMSIMGMRLVSVETGQPIGWGPAFLRGLVVVLGSGITSGLLGLLFWLSPLFDSSTGWAQSWHDKMVKAVFIDTKAGRDTFVQQ
ncbi:hypothetical protein FHU41_000738 [Psychromicrobium silvestre]|uniref:RDD domain-containing protein n=1 Tax=Psychromicrobium silvestre TaxID=1645614 RepID=A0A7Y9LS10_9MICC|nr:RDD family protein [Psychromicrobium silvestre]NYE94517.1 hypothetical protein [Psychromicrobium silvestre]